MNDVPGQVALTGLGIVLLGVALAWLFVGREGRRRWMRDLRKIGIMGAISRALAGVVVLFGTATVTETDLSYPEHLATTLLGVGCLSAGAFFGVKAARRKYPDDYEVMRLGGEPSDPAIRRDVYWLLAKSTLWWLVPGAIVMLLLNEMWG